MGTPLEYANNDKGNANIDHSSARDLDAIHFDEVDHKLPQILTRNTILPSLSTLDAGDVIECYALVRKSKLDTVGTMNMNYNGLGEINNLVVSKSAIAFRYKPKSSSPDVVMKSPFELTLEYGPQRVGATQSFEAMPSVNGHARGLDPNSGDYSGDGKYVTWENHAKVYYTLSISDEEWENAYFMAPITGAVLSKIMSDYILEYPIRHPRYQPFTIIEKETDKTIVKSSNSADFIWNIFKALADMYVDIQPIVTPKRYAVQIYVQNKERDFENIGSQILINTNEGSSGTTNTIRVANAAAQFYDKLFSCMGAIQTGDYRAFEKTQAPSAYPSSSPSEIPSASPTDAPSASLTDAPTVSPSAQPTAMDTVSETSSPTILSTISSTDTNSSTKNETDASVPDEYSDDKVDDNGKAKENSPKNVEGKTEKNSDTTDEIVTPVPDEDNGRARKKKENGNSEGSGNKDRERTTRKAKLFNKKAALVREFSESEELGEDDDYYNDNENHEDDGSVEKAKDTEINYVLDAEFAAQEAKEAATAAKNAAESNEDNKAAIAAGQAAEAAEKAAHATSEAAALAAIDSIYSGDGDMMTSILSTCFTERKYNIRHDEVVDNEIVSTSTDAYVYIDGSHYYRLNLTAPYMSVVTMNNPLPTTINLSEGKGDFIDISLAFCIIGGFFFGMFVMLHHIRLLNYDSRMKFEWFFHPTKYGQGGHKRLDALTDDIEIHSPDDEEEEGMLDEGSFVGNPRATASDPNGIELSNRRSSVNGQIV